MQFTHTPKGPTTIYKANKWHLMLTHIIHPK